MQLFVTKYDAVYLITRFVFENYYALIKLSINIELLQRISGSSFEYIESQEHYTVLWCSDQRTSLLPHYR